MFDKPAVPPTSPPAPQGPERRKHVRYTPNPATSIYLTLADQEKLFPERLADVSAGGLGLVLDRKLEAGTVATVDLYNVTREFPLQIQLRIAYAHEQPDGTVVHGCAFQRDLQSVEVWGLL
jgi:hypothetical protein